MENFITTALVLSGIFVVAYPVILFMMNTILKRMEANAG